MADFTNNSMVKTNLPVLLPQFEELEFSDEKFASFLASTVQHKSVDPEQISARTQADGEASSDINEQDTITEDKSKTSIGQNFMDSLLGYVDKPIEKTTLASSEMFTTNMDVTFSETGSPLVDFFQEFEEITTATRLQHLLETAWAQDADGTLKLIWNTRSIHLGKSNRVSFYRAIGWLYQNHPQTLITNLAWLVRPIVRKKIDRAEKSNSAEDAVMVDAKDEDSDFEMIDDEEDAKQRKPINVVSPAEAEFDVKYGVAHGYWKDLLNILTLAANDELKVDGNPRSIFNKGRESGSRSRQRNKTRARMESTSATKEKVVITQEQKQQQAAKTRKLVLKTRHDNVVKKLEDPIYKALHLTIARLFAQQLRLDHARLVSGSKRDKKQITLAAKWAPSPKGSHDENTFIVSTIAEMLHPSFSFGSNVDYTDRSTYLKHARAAYQTITLSSLRKFLGVVERDITANTFSAIHYDRLPSQAMKQHTPLFLRKDLDHFGAYLDDVAAGTARISGATLLPSVMVRDVLYPTTTTHLSSANKGNSALTQRIADLTSKALDGQWQTLVSRIRDSGTLSSSIAVCDVSGSMTWPVLSDGTQPLHSAIGLSLLISEVTAPPFGGAFISFSEDPVVHRVGGIDDTRSFAEKVRAISTSSFGYNTDFTAVFERLILPIAIKAKLPREEMVKQVFVFSDMQFDQSEGWRGEDLWASSFERVKGLYEKAGYELPKLIFWNLAGSAGGYYLKDRSGMKGAPKPVQAFEENTALVGGYSQAQLKVFLDGGLFEEGKEEEVIEVKEDGDKVVVEKKTAEEIVTPETIMRKAIGHEAYRMLEVVD